MHISTCIEICTMTESFTWQFSISCTNKFLNELHLAWVYDKRFAAQVSSCGELDDGCARNLTRVHHEVFVLFIEGMLNCIQLAQLLLNDFSWPLTSRSPRAKDLMGDKCPISLTDGKKWD